jgi:hypothetical protein
LASYLLNIKKIKNGSRLPSSSEDACYFVNVHLLVAQTMSRMGIEAHKSLDAQKSRHT